MTEEIKADTFDEAVGIFLINHGDMCFADIYDVWDEDQYYDYLYEDLYEEDVYETYGLTK